MEYEEEKNKGEEQLDKKRIETPKEPEVKEDIKEKAKSKSPPIKPYEPPVPYPQRLMKKEYD